MTTPALSVRPREDRPPNQITVKITSSPGETFLDRMIALVEGASRQKTPNEIALDILIAGMTLILLVAGSRCSRYFPMLILGPVGERIVG